MEVEEDDFDLDLLIENSCASRDSLGNNSQTTSVASASLLQLYIFFLLMFQTIFRLSDNALDILLRFVSLFFQSLAKISPLPDSFYLLTYLRLGRYLEIRESNLINMLLVLVVTLYIH